MSFDQLSTVRQDGVVDEDIVFKALWQREALERQLFPLNYQHNQSSFSSQSTLHSTTQIRTQPLDIEKDSNRQPSRLNYHKSTANNHTLLDPPRFRFKASVCLALPHDNNHDGWDKVELTDKTILSVPSTTFMRHVTTDPSHNSLCHDDGDNYDSSDNGGDKLAIKQSSALRNEVRSSSLRQPNGLNGSTTVQENVDISSYDTNDNRNNIRGTICNKIIYTKAEYILDHWHRVRLEAQVLPRSLLQIQDEDDRTGDDNKTDHKNSNNDSSVLVCRFELQRDYTVDPSQDDLTAPSIDLQSSSNDNQQTTQRQSTTTNNQLVPHQGPDQHQSKIRYAIYCLNKHEGLMKNDQVDPDDWVLVPVTEVTESTDPLVQSTGYVGQVLINTDALGNKNTIDVDMMVALEIIGL
ncbi:hypothetical protein BC941DRAFT_408054 [Chlamydoabsidia padenii]|nr:hypothetical protein BC941DRAFT_408054 [Chlamydoabsidia padenii]